jgi:predicted SAM-dependent methyltransferase
MKTYLNLGCGHRFDPSWTNLDFKATSESVIEHNLLSGIPFENESFDVIYHSHVLEHFSKSDGDFFIKECFRVLKPSGIIRIAVPDLECIVKEYIKNLTRGIDGEMNASHDYDWIMLELYDQAVRNVSGGNMAEYLFQEKIPNEEYVFSRIGGEARVLRSSYLKNKLEFSDNKKSNSVLLYKIQHFLMENIVGLFKKEKSAIEKIGSFRLGGEIHQWMYDRYSLKRLIEKHGFVQFKVCKTYESNIPNWERYNFESEKGILTKPDSLIIEAKKP